MSSLFAVSAGAVAVRRVLVKHPWIYWLVVAVAAAGAGAAMLERVDRVDAERAAWGETRSVWVAAIDHEPGDPLTVERRELPRAVVADGAADAVAGLTARQHVAAGEIVHDSDIVALTGPQALTPAGWLVVPVNESPASGATSGDRAQVVGDGVVLSADALVVGHHDGSTLVAVPADEAASVAALAMRDGVTLLLIP
jgi:hypothetical protein